MARRARRGYRGVRALYLRSVGLAYLAAFLSLRRQVLGLLGERGIAPACELLESVQRRRPGRARYRALPTLLWLGCSDRALVRTCSLGAASALALLLGLAPQLAAVACGLLYGSLIQVGDVFLGYQWEALLQENALHAALVAPPGLRPGWGRREPSRLEVALLRWLLFRLHFESGLVKWKSSDRSWRHLEAMEGYYETAPLPTALGWYAHQLPLRLHRLSTAAAMGIELGAPVLGLGPRPTRTAAFGLVTLLQKLIALTGNYGFFNLLTLGMGFWYLDDDQLRALHLPAPRRAGARPSRARSAVATASGAAIGAVSLSPLAALLGWYGARPRWLRRLQGWVEPLGLVNSYGPFSLMTRIRPEITVEGTRDGVAWRPYRFRYKMDALTRRPRWVAPHQPRLDWQMWFAALESPPTWFLRFVQRLLEGSPEVLSLLAENPFPEGPPRRVRARLDLYRMTSRAERRATGAWWKSEARGEYLPEVSLRWFEL